MARQGTTDKLDLLHALQKIDQDLIMQADGVKDLISMVEGMDISDVPAVLSIHMIVTRAASGTAGRTAEGMKDSKVV